MRTDVALVSGGMDSAVAADVAVRWGPCDTIMYLDTGTGTEKNRRYVRRLARWMGVHLWDHRTHESYTDQFRDHGAPGSALHGQMYSKLKERQIQHLAARVEELHCWTGVRYQESTRRMTTVEPESDHYGKWMWHAPIATWSKQECRNYIKRYELPCNELWEPPFDRSGDCFCGCFASPGELLDAEAAGCDDVVRYIDALEQQSDHGDERDRWGGAKTRAEIREARLSEDQMTLCSTCGIKTDGGRDG